MSSLKPFALSLFALSAAACGGRADFYRDALSPLPAVSTRSALVVVVPQANHALVLSPQDAATLTFGQALDLEAVRLIQASRHADHAEAVRAFIDKRAPDFRPGPGAQANRTHGAGEQGPHPGASHDGPTE